MKKKFILYVSILAFLFSSEQLKAQTDYSSLLWEITGNSLPAPSYLFGTMHTLDSSLFESKDLVLEKVMKCDMFVMEDTGDDLNIDLLINEIIMDSLTLSDLLTDEDYELVVNYFRDSLNVNPAVTETIKPVMLVFMYQFKNTLKDSRGNFVSLDDFLKRFAEKNGLPVVSLENSQDYLLYLLNYYSLEEQAEILTEMVKDDRYGLMKENLDQNYRAEDLQRLYLENKNSFPEGLFNILLKKRNELWLVKIPELLNESTVFIAVGAMHLPGESGLIKGLRNLGYDVTPVKTSSVYYGN